MRRGEECRYSLSAALTRLSSEVSRCVERYRAASSRDDGIVTVRFDICRSPSKVSCRVRSFSWNEPIEHDTTLPFALVRLLQLPALVVPWIPAFTHADA